MFYCKFLRNFQIFKIIFLQTRLQALLLKVTSLNPNVFLGTKLLYGIFGDSRNKKCEVTTSLTKC